MDSDFQKEEEFHDRWAKQINLGEVMVDEFFEACISSENRYIYNCLGDVTGKKILELGCGAGEASVYFAKHGAVVTASDLSGGMLEIAKRLAEIHNVDLTVVQCRSDEIPFADETFDVVYAANTLHHVDLEATLCEARRVLKTGGHFVSWDPIAHNPFINIYRHYAVHVRTDDEHPIKMEQIKLVKKYFPQATFKTTWLFTLLIFLKYFLIDRINPNKERYWKKILVEHKKIEKLYNRLEKIDQIVLQKFRFLQRYCWNIVFICKK